MLEAHETPYKRKTITNSDLSCIVIHYTGKDGQKDEEYEMYSSVYMRCLINITNITEQSI